ncbi:thaumatin [Rhexocercosporidium sp. MPI-PUGE-AT-0058]|nr:thaumatin [Rhexocercosporidium sp. MPI-PUGE-AT-0058]
MAANSSLQFGNFIPHGDRIHINGRIQAFFGCNSNCTKCPGDEKVRHTLVEWKYGNDSANPIYEIESWWINLSNVDGYSTNTNVTTYNPKGKVCNKPRSCNATAAALKKVCPDERYWESGAAHGCESDCKATGLHKHCCTGDFSRREPPTCPKSSSFLKELCPDAYASPYDDAGSVDNCHKISGVRIAFWPFA